MSKKLFILGILLILVLSSISGIIGIRQNNINLVPETKDSVADSLSNDDEYGKSTRGMRAQPKCNYTYLYADGTGAVGSTAFRVYDQNLVIFIEAFPGANTDWDPGSVNVADIIIQSPHGHLTHYDADTVAMVATNTGAFVVGNSVLKSDMQSRGINSSQIVELSPSKGGKQSTTVAGVKITSYGMEHTAMTSTQVDTFLIEMPNGVKFFHGTCASTDCADKYMKGKSEFYYLDAMMLDYEHDFGAINSEYSPEILVKDHIIGQTTAVLWTDYPSGQQTLTHNTTHNFQRPVYSPELSDYQVVPESGTNETTYNFSVKYQYRNDMAPTKYQIVIDGTGYDMTAQSASGWREGVEFKYSMELSGGTHQFHFEFEADSKSVRLPASGEINKPEVNSIAYLYGAGVTPSTGNSQTEFLFSITYHDADNDQPSQKKINIDGTSFEMSTTDNTPADGAVYTYKTKLGVGDHTYYFMFSEGLRDIRLPQSGELTINGITRFNTAPELSDWEYSPATGDRDTQFTFYVTFTDADNDGPVKSNIYIDGSEYQMSTSAGTYVNGAKYYYRTKLGMGLHHYHFVFNDSFVDVRAPQDVESGFDGPEVKNRAPVARIKEPDDNSIFTTDDDIKLVGTQSTDPDGDAITFEWSSDIDGVLGTDEGLLISLSEGVHNITLKVTDVYNDTSTKTIKLTIIKLKPELVLGLTIDPVIPQEGQKVTLHADIENVGEAPAEDIGVVIFIDDSELESTTIKSLYEFNEQRISTYFTATAGTHELKLSVSGGAQEKILTLTVSERPKPVAAAGSDVTVSVGEAVNFDADDSTFNGFIVSYFWDFGDDTNDTGSSVTHFYKKAGIYTVTLTLTDDLGKKGSDTTIVTVNKKESEDMDAGLGFYILLPVVIIVIVILLVVFFVLKGKKNKVDPTGTPPQTLSQLPGQVYYQQPYVQPVPNLQYPQIPQQGFDTTQPYATSVPEYSYSQLQQPGYDANLLNAAPQDMVMQQLPSANNAYTYAEGDLHLSQEDTLSSEILPGSPFDDLQSVENLPDDSETHSPKDAIDVQFSNIDEPETENLNNSSNKQPKFGKSLTELEKEQNGH